MICFLLALQEIRKHSDAMYVVLLLFLSVTVNVLSDTVLIHIIDDRRQERLRKIGKSQMTIYTKNLLNIKRLGPSSG